MEEGDEFAEASALVREQVRIIFGHVLLLAPTPCRNGLIDLPSAHFCKCCV
jgi:hypothetical protein